MRVAGQECQVTRQAEEQRRQDEELARREQEAFNLAMICFNSRGACAAGGCFDSYLQQYPNGRFTAAARAKTAGAQNQCVLPNGIYSATRSSIAVS